MIQLQCPFCFKNELKPLACFMRQIPGSGTGIVSVDFSCLSDACGKKSNLIIARDVAKWNDEKTVNIACPCCSKNKLVPINFLMEFPSASAATISIGFYCTAEGCWKKSTLVFTRPPFSVSHFRKGVKQQSCAKWAA